MVIDTTSCAEIVFFFKQKTAYEMRISDWSSDVCSSDLMGMAMEMVFDGSNGMPSAGDYADLQPEELGRETIGGEAVTKYRIEAGEGGESYTVLIWATDDGIALRMEGATAEGGFEMQLSDLERGPQPADLFEVPAGKIGRESCRERGCQYV